MWVTYFTSSKKVKNFRCENGEPDIIEIRRTFSNRDKAIEWEKNVLIRMNLKEDSRFLNQTNNGAVEWKKCSVKWSDERKRKFSEYRTGQKHSEETKLKMRKSSQNQERPWLRRKRPEQSIAIAGKSNGRSISFVLDGLEYETIKDFCIRNNMNRYKATHLLKRKGILQCSI